MEKPLTSRYFISRPARLPVMGEESLEEYVDFKRFESTYYLR